MRKIVVVVIVVLLLTGCATPGGRGFVSKWFKPVDTSRLYIGMSVDAVKNVTRFPDDINKTMIGDTYQEQWVYRGSDYSTTYYLYFENGKLTAWQEN